MIKIEDTKASICYSCGYTYNSSFVRTLCIQTDKLEDGNYTSPINVNVQLCGDCRKLLKEKL